MHSPSSR